MSTVLRSTSIRRNPPVDTLPAMGETLRMGTRIQRTAQHSPYLGDHSEYLRAVARMIRAAGVRVGDGDPTDLAELIELRAHVELAIDAALAAQRGRHSLAEIAAELGVSRQAVHKMSRSSTRDDSFGCAIGCIGCDSCDPVT